MKKYLFISLIIFLPFFAKAQVLGFQDGKFYDINSGDLKYFKLMDGSYFDIDGKQVWKDESGNFSYTQPQVLGVSKINSFTLVTMPNQQLPHTLNGQPFDETKNYIPCSYINDTISCINETASPINVKSVLFDSYPVKFDGDYSSITDNIVFITNQNKAINFIPDTTNTKFTFISGVTFAKFMVTLDPAVYLMPNNQMIPQSVLKIHSTYVVNPSAVLIQINGQDVVYKIN